MAIHLAPSLPVISQPHVFWERVGGEGQTCLVHSYIIPSGQGQGSYVHVFGIMPRFRNHPRRCSFELSIPTRVQPGAARRGKINHLADKRDEVTNEVG